MGDEQRLSPDEQITLAREQFESGRDFTLAVEEEFALLDPTTLGLVSRFEELFEAAQSTDFAEHVVGELISSEIEVRTGRCESFDEAAAKLAERRAQMIGLAERHGVALGATGAHPWSPWQEQKIIDTPHYRRNDELLRYVVWRNNTFGLHVHVGIRGADRAVAVCNGLRTYLPDLLALSASSPVRGGRLHLPALGANADLHAHVPARRRSGRVRELGRIRALYSLPLRHRVGDRAHAVVVERASSPRLPDRRDPHLRRTAGAHRGPLARRAHVRAHRADRVRGRRARALPALPHRLIEENLWRAIRHGLAGELIELGTDRIRPARAALEELVDWVMPAAEELGCRLPPRRAACERG